MPLFPCAFLPIFGPPIFFSKPFDLPKMANRSLSPRPLPTRAEKACQNFFFGTIPDPDFSLSSRIPHRFFLYPLPPRAQSPSFFDILFFEFCLFLFPVFCRDQDFMRLNAFRSPRFFSNLIQVYPPSFAPMIPSVSSRCSSRSLHFLPHPLVSWQIADLYISAILSRRF